MTTGEPKASAQKQGAAWPLGQGQPVYAIQATCECGSQFFACPTCGNFRCLHCDPVEVAPEREPSCHDE